MNKIKGKYIIFPNKQKKLFENEKWTTDRDLMNIPGMRALLIGKCNSGKSNTIFNIIIHSQPQFNKIYLCHPEFFITSSQTKEDSDDESDDEEHDIPEEYKILQESGYSLELLKQIPTTAFFKRNMFDDEGNLMKSLLILDDIKISDLKPKLLARLEKCCSYASSHYNVNIVITSQIGLGSIPPSIPRLLNTFVVWKSDDLWYEKQLLNRVGINKYRIDNIMKELETYALHDCLVIDSTPNSPATLRKNWYNKLTL